MERIRIADDNWNFVEGDTGRCWAPFGANYYDPLTGWAPKMWSQWDDSRVERHFDEMACIGVKVVRVFLCAYAFLDNAPEFNPEQMTKWEKMMGFARKTGIRLQPLTFGGWEGRARWYTPENLVNEEVRKIVRLALTEFASRYRDDPIIFSFDLANEPRMHWVSETITKRFRQRAKELYDSISGANEAWGTSFGSFDAIEPPPDENAPGSQYLFDYQMLREDLAGEWARARTDAIHQGDPNQLSTIGLLRGTLPGWHVTKPSQYLAFHTEKLADTVDFMAWHYYPCYERPRDNIKTREIVEKNLQLVNAGCRSFYCGKPVTINEFGFIGGTDKPMTQGNGLVIDAHSEEEQADFLEAVMRVTMGACVGWMNWAAYDTPSSADISIYSGLMKADGTVKEWGKRFARLAKEIEGKKLVRDTTAPPIELNRREIVTDLSTAWPKVIEQISKLTVDPKLHPMLRGY